MSRTHKDRNACSCPNGRRNCGVCNGLFVPKVAHKAAKRDGGRSDEMKR